MYLEVFADNPYATNCWLLARDDRDDAMVVDPGFSPDRVLALLGAAGKRPAAVVATHGHLEHIGSAAELCGDDVPFYIHAADELALTDPEAWGAGYPAAPARPEDVRTFDEGDIVGVAGFELRVLHTPGHTPGSSCFHSEDVFFSGDLVFRGSIGRYDFPNSSAAEMFASLRRFLALPDELDVYPGHGKETNVALERATNPFLRQLA
jgi:hydroxyacylglutathione hydrolase